MTRAGAFAHSYVRAKHAVARQTDNNRVSGFAQLPDNILATANRPRRLLPLNVTVRFSAALIISAVNIGMLRKTLRESEATSSDGSRFLRELNRRLALSNGNLARLNFISLI